MPLITSTSHQTYARWTVNGVTHYASTDDGVYNGNAYTAALTADAELDERWTDDVARGSSITLRVLQLPSEVDTLLDESDDPLLDENGDALLTESPAYASLAMFDVEGLDVTIETVTTVTFDSGPDWVLAKPRTLTLTDREFAPGVVAITLKDIEDERLNTLFPPRTYSADDFPQLGEVDSGRAVPRILGTALKLRGALITSASPYRYALCDASEALLLDVLTVYRGRNDDDLRVIDPAEYTTGIASDPYPHLYVEFAAEQRGFDGALYTIAADVRDDSDDVPVTYALDMLASAVGITWDGPTYALLDSFTWGNNRLISFDAGRDGQRTIRAILEDLLAVASASLYRSATGDYAFAVDGEGVSLGTWDEDAGDDIEVLSVRDTARPASIAITYRPGPADPEDLIQTQVREVGGSQGEQRPRGIRYLRNAEVADRVACYRAAYARLNRRVRARIYRTTLSVGDVITLNSSAWNVGRSDWRVRSAQSIVGGVEVECSPYDASLYTYTPGDIPASALIGYSPDYSATPPSAPSNLRILSTTATQQGDGAVTANVYADVTPPPVNWSVLWLAAIHNVTGELTIGPMTEIVVEEGLRYAATLTGLRPGEVYQLQAWAVNAFGLRGPAQATFDAAFLQDADEATTFTTAGYATVPPDVTGIAVAQLPPRGLEVKWSAVTLANLREYVLERAVGAGAFVEVWRGASRSYIDRDVAYGSSYTYRVKARDTWGNLSANYNTSGAISLATGSVYGGSSGNDIGSSTVDTYNRTNVSTVSASVGAPTLTGLGATISHALGRVPMASANTSGKGDSWANVTNVSSTDVIVTAFGAPTSASPNAVNAANPHQHFFFYSASPTTVAVNLW